MNKLNKIIDDREIILISLTGSRLYKLNNEKSDYDYKVIVRPFNSDKNYYHYYKDYNKEYNFIDVKSLFSSFYTHILIDIWFDKNIKYNKNKYPEITWIINNKETIIKLYLEHLFEFFIYKANIKINNNELYHGYRLLDVLERYYNNDFSSFENALIYNDNKEEILNIKNNIYSFNYCMKIAKNKYNSVIKLEKYYQNRVDKITNEKLNNYLYLIENKK